ncbi:hypothetical protein AB833_20500 [Chromatiales bacterium (ex Bugula neritina AB1)]|nr:hypothetical protein AB833_20500 [Chromatiales bacterium (ex Bugula neritina AB1)]
MNDSKDSNRRVRRSRDEWQQLITEYESENLTQKEFCAKHNLGSVSFSKWYHRLKSTQGNDFVALPAIGTEKAENVSGVTQPCNHFEVRLELGDGLVLHLSRQ